VGRLQNHPLCVKWHNRYGGVISNRSQHHCMLFWW
jgi:hypothetical protein